MNRFYKNTLYFFISILVVVASSKSAQGQAPGGVNTNLTLWLKADAGTTGSPTVTAWDDQSGNGNNTTASGDPQLYRH